MRGFQDPLCPSTDWFHDPNVANATDLDVIRWLRQCRKAGVHPHSLAYIQDFYFSEAVPVADTCVPFNLIDSVVPGSRVRQGLAYDLAYLRLQITVVGVNFTGGSTTAALARHFKFALVMCHEWDVYISGALQASRFWNVSLNPTGGMDSFEFLEAAPASDGDPIAVWTPLWESRGYMYPPKPLVIETHYFPAQYDPVPPPGLVTFQPLPVTETHFGASNVYCANLVVPLKCRHQLRTSTFSHRAGSWTNFPILFMNVQSNAAEPLAAHVPRVYIKAELHYTYAFE